MQLKYHTIETSHADGERVATNVQLSEAARAPCQLPMGVPCEHCAAGAAARLGVQHGLLVLLFLNSSFGALAVL